MDAFLIRCYLWARDVPWSEELTEQLLEDLGGFLAERGFNNSDEDELRSVLVAGSVDIPELEAWVDEWSDDPTVQIVVFPAHGSHG